MRARGEGSLRKSDETRDALVAGVTPKIRTNPLGIPGRGKKLKGPEI